MRGRCFTPSGLLVREMKWLGSVCGLSLIICSKSSKMDDSTIELEIWLTKQPLTLIDPENVVITLDFVFKDE